MAYPSIGQPPFNCNICGGRTIDRCPRHPSESGDRLILVDKHLSMSVRRHIALAVVPDERASTTHGGARD
jgi:hypothetical protein